MSYLVLILILGVVYVAHRVVSQRSRQRALLAAPLTREARALLDETVPLLRRLPPALRPALEGKMNRFLDQVTFVGCDGLEVTEEMRLSIAAQACLLIVNIDQWYDTLRTILIYPS